MDKLSYRVALGGVISSLCILSMFIASIAPFLAFTMPMIAGALMSVIAVEVNKSWGVLTYGAVSLLSLFIVSNKEAVLIFILLFGYYPIIKIFLDNIKLKFLRVLAKLLLFNIVIVAYYYTALYILGISDMEEDFAVVGKWGIYIFWVIVNITLFIYDYALKGCTELYIRFLKPKIK